MKRLKVLKGILKRTHADRILLGYVGFLFIVAGVILVIEPEITSYGDSLWYCYTMSVTIGFGDIVPITLIGRILTIVLSLYSLLLIGMVPAIIVNYYMAIVRAREDAALGSFLDKLENLPDLSREDLIKLSDQIKKLR
ncbi:MAG: potassium channel family protein [Anaerovoracaceae bacterium]